MEKEKQKIENVYNIFFKSFWDLGLSEILHFHAGAKHIIMSERTTGGQPVVVEAVDVGWRQVK